MTDAECYYKIYGEIIIWVQHYDGRYHDYIYSGKLQNNPAMIRNFVFNGNNYFKGDLIETQTY